MATLKDRFINALLGKPVQGQYSSPSVSYGENIDNYLNTLDKQPYMQQLLNQPKETGLTLDQYKEGVANGFNYGIPEIAKAQEQLGIRIPKTDEEKELAKLGQFNKPSQLNIGASNDIRKGGFINDLVGGYKENYNQGFDINNLEPRNRSFATRFGEGLGTIGRFADSPLGRGLIAYGLSNAVGDTNPLEQAITAGVGRYNNQTNDKIYRNQLKQMGMDEGELNAIRGDITKDVFNSIVSGMRYNNQRVTWGQLAQISPEIAQMVIENPELENTFIPINLARDIYGLKRETAQGKMAETKAKTEKTQAETKQVGKPKVNINIKQGGTTSRIIHEGGSPKPTKPERPTQATGGGRPRGAVKILAPDGKVRFIPADKVNEAIANGGKRV